MEQVLRGQEPRVGLNTIVAIDVKGLWESLAWRAGLTLWRIIFNGDNFEVQEEKSKLRL